MSDSKKKDGAQLQDDAKVIVKDVKVMADDLLKTAKNILNEGNVRRITVKDKQGNTIASFPLAVGVIGTVLAPVLVALGALSAILSECTLTVERVS